MWVPVANGERGPIKQKEEHYRSRRLKMVTRVDSRYVEATYAYNCPCQVIYLEEPLFDVCFLLANITIDIRQRIFLASSSILRRWVYCEHNPRRDSRCNVIR